MHHIRVGRRCIDIPSLVRKDSERHVDYALTSPLEQLVQNRVSKSMHYTRASSSSGAPHSRWPSLVHKESERRQLCAHLAARTGESFEERHLFEIFFETGIPEEAKRSTFLRKFRPKNARNMPRDSRADSHRPSRRSTAPILRSRPPFATRRASSGGQWLPVGIRE
eukprot:10700_1